MLGALISGGLSALSGLFGRSRAKKENAEAQRRADAMNADVRARAEAAAKIPVVTTSESSNSVDMDGFMAAARDHGFNPLTFLRSGALSLFTSSKETNSVSGSMNMEAALAGQYVPQLSSVPSVGEIVTGGLSTAFSQWSAERSQQQQNQFQLDLVRAQLEGVQGSSYRGSRSFNVPTATMSGGTRTGSGTAALAETATVYRNPGDKLCFWGWCMGTDSGTSSAEDIETRYGDVAQEAWGIATGVADLGKAGVRVKDAFERDFRSIAPGVDAIAAAATGLVKWSTPVNLIPKAAVPALPALRTFGTRGTPSVPGTGFGAMVDDAMPKFLRNLGW